MLCVPLPQKALRFHSVSVQEIYHEDGVYYGQNVISKNMIIANRRHLLNGNSFILGVSGAGKSFTERRKMTNIILTTPMPILLSLTQSENIRRL
jgi:hypothetical protein